MTLNNLTWQKCLADIRANGGSTPTGTITITENGEYDVAQYATADVNVSGGSSDFQTAEVTIVADESGIYAQFYGRIQDVSTTFDLPAGTLPDVITYVDSEVPTEPLQTSVALYQGNTISVVSLPEDNVTVSGNATKHEYGDDYKTTVVTITGDCSISFSGSYEEG